MLQKLGSWAARAVRVLALAIAVGGCVTPTLPPDEPPAPEVELGVGVARLSGHVGVGPAFVLVHNRASGLVFGERTPTGAYDFEVRTEPCDVLVFWYTMGSFQSPAISFQPAEIEGPRGTCPKTAVAPVESDAGIDP